MNESFVVNPTDEGFEIEQERFECGVCNFTSRFKSNVRRHERRHLTEGSDPPGVEDGRIGILCDQCARPFKTKRGLKLHVHTKHLNIFRFKCSVCPSQFNMLSAFRGHLASHHRELKEKCAQCGAAFQYKHSAMDPADQRGSIKFLILAYTCSKDKAIFSGFFNEINISQTPLK